MSWHGATWNHYGRCLVIMFMIIGLIHAPLPQPDFHNIRHHDAPGEVCEHHDHLLRWHPGAGIAADVAVLHWHWFLPAGGPFDLPVEGTGPAVHAHVVDWQASTWEDGPRVSVDTTRVTATLDPWLVLSLLMVPAEEIHSDLASGAQRVRAFSATFAPSAPLACLFQRWDC